MTIGGTAAGDITLMHRANVAFKTPENFRTFLTGERVIAFHRADSDFMCQGGNFPSGSGTGGESLYGSKSDDVFISLRHGVLGHICDGLVMAKMIGAWGSSTPSHRSWSTPMASS
eukprot:UN2464